MQYVRKFTQLKKCQISQVEINEQMEELLNRPTLYVWVLRQPVLWFGTLSIQNKSNNNNNFNHHFNKKQNYFFLLDFCLCIILFCIQNLDNCDQWSLNCFLKACISLPKVGANVFQVLSPVVDGYDLEICLYKYTVSCLCLKPCNSGGGGLGGGQCAISLLWCLLLNIRSMIWFN